MSLTTANSVIALSFQGVFDTPQVLQGFSADDIFDTADVSNAEVSMGIDGKLSYAFVPVATVQTFTLQADSPSVAIFDTVITAEKTAKEKFRVDGTITLPGLGVRYTMTNGVISSFTPVSGAKKSAQPRHFVVTWQDCIPTPI